MAECRVVRHSFWSATTLRWTRPPSPSLFGPHSSGRCGSSGKIGGWTGGVFQTFHSGLTSARPAGPKQPLNPLDNHSIRDQGTDAPSALQTPQTIGLPRFGTLHTL